MPVLSERIRVVIPAVLVAFAAAPVLAAQQPGTPPAGGVRTDTVQRPAGDTLPRTGAKAAPAPPPAADQARGVDAEIRIALFELMNDRPLPALGRLQFLSQSPVALTSADAQARALRGREDLLFLLAQGYYRYGMDSSFRAIAQGLMTAPGAARYAPLLRGQLLLEAYRSGDYPRAIELAKTLAQSEMRGLAGLIHGLSHYQTQRWNDAKLAFAEARQAGEPYATYAQYMDAVVTIRGDTAQTAAGLTQLQQLASSARGEIADQIRLTAAQLAYEAGQYDQASQLAGGVTEGSGLAGQALLVRAWSLYKANQLQAAGDAFARFASTYPMLPERDESRMMHGQVLLQLGRTDEAGSVFRLAMDSVTAEARALEQRGASVTGDAARALVQARAAGLLFVADPSTGKTVALSDEAGTERAILAVVADTVTTPPEVRAPDLISVADIRQRIAAVQGLPAALDTRVFFAPASATGNRALFNRRAMALYDADVALALARHRLDEALAAYRARLALVERLKLELTAQNDSLTALGNRLTAAADSLNRLGVYLDAARIRLRQMFAGQVNATRLLADENIAYIDSLRRSLSTSLGSEDDQLIAIERSTATIYRAIADEVERGLDSALRKHPAFALRDSISVKGLRTRSLLSQTQQALASALQAVDAEIARLRAGDPSASGGLRAAVASAEARRTAAEQGLIGIVRAELDARAAEMVAELKRDAEAAEFGSASVTFFKALDAQRAENTAGSAAAPAAAPGASAGTGNGATPPR